jgi:hypothetical protein
MVLKLGVWLLLILEGLCEKLVIKISKHKNPKGLINNTKSFMFLDYNIVLKC